MPQHTDEHLEGIVSSAQILPFPGTEFEPFRIAPADRPLASSVQRRAAKPATGGEPTTFQRCLAVHMFYAARTGALD